MLKNSYVNATTMMGLLSLDVNRTKTPMRQCPWLAIFDSSLRFGVEASFFTQSLVSISY